jgi:hypothetical protein
MQDFARFAQRVEPKLPPGAMQTYDVSAPLETHWRSATCAEVECKAFMQGWSSDVLDGSVDEARLAKAYESDFRRGAIRGEKLETGFIRYHFPAGTACFRQAWHKLPLERPALFMVRSGDWRGTDGVIRRFATGADWVDHFATHLDGISERVSRG